MGIPDATFQLTQSKCGIQHSRFWRQGLCAGIAIVPASKISKHSYSAYHLCIFDLQLSETCSMQLARLAISFTVHWVLPCSNERIEHAQQTQTQTKRDVLASTDILRGWVEVALLFPYAHATKQTGFGVPRSYTGQNHIARSKSTKYKRYVLPTEAKAEFNLKGDCNVSCVAGVFFPNSEINTIFFFLTGEWVGLALINPLNHHKTPIFAPINQIVSKQIRAGAAAWPRGKSSYV